MEFEYLQQCYNESLRIEPPTTHSFHQEWNADTWIKHGDKQIMFKKGTRFQIAFDAIMHDPVQWREPDRYMPERFDTRNKDNIWSLTSEGKPRNPLAFTPFMGGKRVCLGKTFAEVNFRFTIPLLFHYLDFEFADPAEMTNVKQLYSLAGKTDWHLPMKLIIKNKV